MSIIKRLFLQKQIDHLSEDHQKMRRVLGVKDLTMFGIAAIIGGGTFSAIGNACYFGGPGVVILYIICGIACGFTALCYAEFSSRVPVSGSAYTYAYVSFGELFAWIIGWALLLEYSIGNIYVAFSWSGYFTHFLETIHIHLPEWLTINYSTAHRDFLEHRPSEGLTAWNTAPEIAGLKIIFDMPAVAVNLIITTLVFVGTRESKHFSNWMVYIKLAIILLIIVVGVFYVDIDNWTPFMPNGFGGVMSGVSAVFFAYIGFDAVSTLAEETKNPQKNLPRGMLYALVICTLLYVALALVLTGMVSYQVLGVNDPLAEVFKLRSIKWMSFWVSIAAVVAMTSVLLVFQMGQPRIWMSMSRDGLLPKKFAEIHPRFKTPWFATIVTGLVVGVPIFFTNEEFVLDFTSIGTLFAFVLVCGGLLILPKRPKHSNPPRKSFRMPYYNSQWIFPIITLFSVLAIFKWSPTYFENSFFTEPDIPLIVFWILVAVMVVLAFVKKLSLIPLLGFISCCYLLTGMGVSNWKWFGLWLVIGLSIYFSYGYRKSELRKEYLLKLKKS